MNNRTEGVWVLVGSEGLGAPSRTHAWAVERGRRHPARDPEVWLPATQTEGSPEGQHRACAGSLWCQQAGSPTPRPQPPTGSATLRYVLVHVEVAELVEHLSVRRQRALPEDVDRVLAGEETGPSGGASRWGGQGWRPHPGPQEPAGPRAQVGRQA